MTGRRNYQKELDAILGTIRENNARPTLLLHACCAPCSSYVLEYLSRYFYIILCFYNPNITREEEYRRREKELKCFTEKFPLPGGIEILPVNYDPEHYLEAVRGLEDEPEGGARCEVCYELRLREAAAWAKRRNADWFTTTLSISPLKNAEKLNAIGEKIGAEMGIRYLPSDFKKRDGYRRSVELSGEYGLYRQDYCGCVFSERSEVL